MRLKGMMKSARFAASLTHWRIKGLEGGWGVRFKRGRILFLVFQRTLLVAATDLAEDLRDFRHTQLALNGRKPNAPSR
jgi:hypothetical protein